MSALLPNLTQNDTIQLLYVGRFCCVVRKIVERREGEVIMPPANKKSSAAKELENRVRNIARLRWGVPAQSEHIAGVNYDCILRVGKDEIVAIEATCQNNADKLRKDINDRLGHLKRNHPDKIMVVRCYFVMQQEPSPAMVEYGRSAGVYVMSIAQFQNELLDYTAYVTLRGEKSFGSAINYDTGENDKLKYIPVQYHDDEGNSYNLEDIIHFLEMKKKIILLGEYGTGKSRCIHEIFNHMSKNNSYYTFAINLRENWGLDRKSEILMRHFQDLGLGSMTDAVIRISQTSQCCLLLDGFDEIGIQSWSADFAKVILTRRASLKGVAELISNSSGGILITGREQYFNSNKEMFLALGIGVHDTIVLRCPEQFTDSEMREYLEKANPAAIDLVPEWVPKRPMIYNILANLDTQKLEDLSNRSTSYRDCWNLLITYICNREANIRGAIWDGRTILNILKETSHMLLKKGNDLSHITLDELNTAFKAVTGMSADADASIILQRLPGLGRISAENSDRVFTDIFLLNGLKASYLMDTIEDFDEDAPKETWEGLVRDVGYNILQDDYEEKRETYTTYFKKNIRATNNYLLGMLVMLITNMEEKYDFRNVVVQNVNYHDTAIPIQLKSEFSNLTFKSCLFGELDITDCTSNSLYVNDCQIARLTGIGNIDGKPNWIDVDSIIDVCQPYWAVASIHRNTILTSPQKALLSIIKKIFFQDGRGRQESALVRGLGDKERNYIKPILQIMKREGVIEEHVINRKTIFSQKRACRGRMSQIQSKLTLSDDIIWQEVSSMKQ